jgi:2-polyprenyl-3-methyl-5-hydroxy-6-metoxy-1,4-benzoquinol methylase
LNACAHTANPAGGDLNLEISKLVPENVYGSSKRLAWLTSHLSPKDSILELGCGTGFMICLPLFKLGYSIQGLDLDTRSIEYGRNIFKESNADPTCLHVMNLEDMGEKFDAIIASEVLEHLETAEVNQILKIIHGKLNPGGRLLVTVPNGFGWFEMDTFIWNKLGLKIIFEKTRLLEVIYQFKKLFLKERVNHPPHPSTLSNSPHRQRFSLNGIIKLLKQNHFRVEEATGSVLLSGPLMNVFFHGVSPFIRANCALGTIFPHGASSFFIACKASQNAGSHDS